MSEKEKMLKGLPYQPWEQVLEEERNRAKDVLFAFNAMKPSMRKERKELLASLLDALGEFHIESPFQCDYGYNIHVGENFYANHNCIMLDCAPITIGDNVMLAPNVAIYTAGHPIYAQTRNTGIEYALAVTIGDNVWIGGNTVINPGVHIGNNVVIGSGSLVNKDIPDNVLAVGNPIHIIREITEADKDYFYKNQNFTL